MECPECGAMNLDGAERCNACGKSLSAEDTTGGSMGSPSRNTWVLVGVLAAAAVVLLGVMLSVSGPGGGGGGSGSPSGDTTSSVSPESTLPPDIASTVASEAATDFELNKAKDYAGFYRRLADSDRKQVTEADWIARSQLFEEMNGTIESYTILNSSFMDAEKTIIAVDVQVKYSLAENPVLVEVHYVEQGGAWVPSMLWGRTIESSAPATGTTQ